ncbi:MAG: hypothetical protein VCG02_19585 [Verrucomicrobiota bacterium]
MNLSTSSSSSAWCLLRDLVLYALLVVLTYTGLCYVFYTRPHLLIGEQGWISTYRRVDRAQEALPYKTVYLGDSVGAQFFPFQHMPNALTVNGAVLMAGQLVLAGMASEHPDVERIVLAITPESLLRPFEHEMTFNNYVKPFYSRGNRAYILPITDEKVARHRWGVFSRHVPVKFLPFSDVNYGWGSGKHDTIPHGERDVREASRYAVEHIQHLVSLVETRGKRVVFVSPPVSRSRHDASKGYRASRSILQQAGLSGHFDHYFDQMIVLEDAAFTDKMHLNPRRLPELKQALAALLER